MNEPTPNADSVLLADATDQQIAVELRKRGYTSTDLSTLRDRIAELEEYAGLLERGLSAHEARDTVWPAQIDGSGVQA